MNRRSFLRMAAGVAAALGLAPVPKAVAKEPETLLGFPIKYERPEPTEFYTNWIDCVRYEDLALIPEWRYMLYLDESCLEMFPPWQLPEADRGWHSVQTKGPVTAEWYDEKTNTWRPMSSAGVKLVEESHGVLIHEWWDGAKDEELT